ncbi:acyltransferase [Arthrobacter sp. EH-1B-1]|uniref:Acyltransferase n=1 Tax=Arthrobacter vasquezii TaxID=2977629 RepID=A0ABT6CXA9_9MICC|nr:acyltransferase [Arthrobacter vasquezii]MDF9278721.1 acyltransferase [Arthrobacter vasquezii]
MSTTPLNGANRFAHIDALRTLAVMLVVFSHAGLGHIIPGGAGVTIFFSISGFIITYLLLREKAKTGRFDIKGFYFRRARKIIPALVITLGIPTLIYAIIVPIDWAAFAAQLFFVFNWVSLSGHGPVLPGSQVVWSLSIEEQFYIGFAILWLITVRARYWRAITIAIATLGIAVPTTLRLTLALQADSSDRIYYGTDTRLDGIALGMLTAVLFHRWQSGNARRGKLTRAFGSDWALISACALILVSLLVRDAFFRDTFRYSLQSIATCVIITYGLLPGEGMLRRAFFAVSIWKPVASIGLASYSIYLVHLVIMSALREPFTFVPLPLSVITLSAIGVLIGLTVYRFIEVPTHERWKRKAAKRELAADESARSSV